MAALPQVVFETYVGLIKTFGPFGPMYEVLGDAEHSVTGDRTVAVRVVRTGETLDYELAAMLADPGAQ